jgi:hemoglobin-like flavoprotein
MSASEGLESAVAAATASYQRCQEAPDFFKTFYDRFLAADPRLPPLFANTEFPRQYKLLQHALGLLLSFARHRDPALLERLAVRHGPSDLDIVRPMYDIWVWALLEAVRAHDPKWGPRVEQAWRDAVAPGIRFMAEHGR